MDRGFLEFWRNDTWIRPYLGKYGKILALAVLSSVIACLFAGALMFTSGYMISLAATMPFTVLALHVPSIFVRIFGIGKPVIQYFERLESHNWVLKMTSGLRLRMYNAVEARWNSRRIGEMLGVFASDIEHAQDLYLRTIFPFVTAIAVYAVTAIVMGLFSPVAALLLLVMLAVVLFITPLWAILANAARIEAAEALNAYGHAALTEDVCSVNDWHLSGRRRDFIDRNMEPYREIHRLKQKIGNLEIALSIIRQMVYAVCIVAILVWSYYAFSDFSNSLLAATPLAHDLGRLAMHDSVPYAANWIAAFVLCSFPLLEVFSPLSEASLGFVKAISTMASLNSLDEGTDTEKPCGGASHSLEEPPPGFAVSLDDVSFSYGLGASVFEGLSLDIPVGQHVAIVGRSGVGKTTLLDIIRGRIAPSKGNVSVSGKIGVIEQDPYIFRKSLRENLLVAKPDAKDDELLEALRAVDLEDLLERLPNGLDSMMVEGGTTISGGERHRLALARIILFDCDVALLDEPYKGLDSETEHRVSKLLLEALGGKTIIAITHSLQEIGDFDRVIVMGDRGVKKDIERGHPDYEQSRILV